jgi:sensor histidine kinase YesM
MTEKKGLSLYWKCQLTGWSLASLYWAFIGMTTGEFDLMIGLLQFITDVMLYVSLTHSYRNFVLKLRWPELPLNKLISRIIPAILVMGCAYTLFTLCKLYLFRAIFFTGVSDSFFSFAQTNGVAIFVAGIRLMSIWLLAYHLYHYAQREIRLAKENARLAIESRDAQLNNLASQLNPHFLFNSLNTIKALVANEPENARRGIDLLSEVLRSSLYRGDAFTISIKEELDLVQDYLALEKLRMQERLSFDITADEKIAERLIPRLCIQTLAENAVKHGVSKSVTGGIIQITVSQQEDFTKIVVANTGTFTDSVTVKGIGLQNLKKRLNIMYQHKAICEMDASGNMVTITLLIPAE